MSSVYINPKCQQNLHRESFPQSTGTSSTCSLFCVWPSTRWSESVHFYNYGGGQDRSMASNPLWSALCKCRSGTDWSRYKKRSSHPHSSGIFQQSQEILQGGVSPMDLQGPGSHYFYSSITSIIQPLWTCGFPPACRQNFYKCLMSILFSLLHSLPGSVCLWRKSVDLIHKPGYQTTA